MPISHRHRAIFIHIPKTGGTSIEAVLGMHGERADVGLVPFPGQVPDRERFYGRGLQHLTGPRLREELGDDAVFAAYFKFSVVRNPWDRLVSTCAWADRKWADGRMLDRDEFEAFVRRTHAAFTAAAPRHPHVVPQVEYVLDAAGRPIVDFLARFETLDRDWQVVRARLGIEADLPVRMRSVHRPYAEYYGPDTRAMVAEIYAGDIDAFGYRF